MLLEQSQQQPAMQLPLIHTVDKNDQLLINSPDAEWYRILKYFPSNQFLIFTYIAVSTYNYILTYITLKILHSLLISAIVIFIKYFSHAKFNFNISGKAICVYKS